MRLGRKAINFAHFLGFSIAPLKNEFSGKRFLRKYFIVPNWEHFEILLWIVRWRTRKWCELQPFCPQAQSELNRQFQSFSNKKPRLRSRGSYEKNVIFISFYCLFYFCRLLNTYQLLQLLSSWLFPMQEIPGIMPWIHIQSKTPV